MPITQPPPPKSDPRLQDALNQLRSLMMKGENLEAWATQPRINALTHRRFLIAATSVRFIALYRGLFSGYEMRDLPWQDLREVRIRMSSSGADLTLIASPHPSRGLKWPRYSYLRFLGFLKDETREVYRLCQAYEQAWREKLRIRELEEMRAQSGSKASDPVTRLLQAKQLLDAKLISDAEYEAIKARVVGDV